MASPTTDMSDILQAQQGCRAVEPPPFQHVLVVDDNRFYAEVLSKDLRSREAIVERAASAEEGLAILADHGTRFDALVTDISMENELAGLRLLRLRRRGGFDGKVAVSSTALDSRFGMFVNRWILISLYRADYLIPKRPIRNERAVQWLQCGRAARA